MSYYFNHRLNRCVLFSVFTFCKEFITLARRSLLFNPSMPPKDFAFAPSLLYAAESFNAFGNFGTLDLLTSHDFDRVTKLASIISGSPIALVYFFEDGKDWIQANTSIDIEPFRNSGFHRYTVSENSLVEISDAADDGTFAREELVTGKNSIRFYAGLPLMNSLKKIVGTLQVYDTEVKELSPRQKTGLQLLAEEVISLLEERSRKANPQNFEKHFEFSTDLVFIGGDDGYFQQINPAFEKVLGWSKEHLLTTSTFDFLHPDDVDSTSKELNKLQEGGRTVNFLQRFKTIKGDYRTIQWTSTPELSTGRIFGIGRDVTEIQALELELRNTRQMLEQTNKVAKVGGWSLDVDSKKIYWSTITKEIHGVPDDYEPDLLTGINFYKEGESREKIMSALEVAFAVGKPWDLQLQLINNTGKAIWVRAIGNAEMENGECKRLFGTFQDINDSKLAEIALKFSLERQDELNQVLSKQIELVKVQDKTIEKIKEFKFMTDAIPQIVWTASPDGFADYFNEHWFSYTGLSTEQSLGRGWLSVLHPDDLPQMSAVWRDAMATQEPFEIEYRFKSGAGNNYKWHLGRGIPMKENGEVVKWFGSSTDIDEYKRALQLENRISQYEDFNRIVAHNLRGPSGSIKMLLNLLAKDDCDVMERRDVLSMLKQSSDVLSETLNELMKVLEVRNNRNLAFDDCNVEEIIQGTERMLMGQLKAKEAIITSNLATDTVKFPKLYLESIFYNIISNALKYSKSNVPPRIAISCEQLNGRTLLRFKDNGLGIDLQRHQQDLFKLNKVFHRGFDSKGVGLFMTKTQIETFGGRIWVESEPNVGSEFFVEL